MSAEAGSDARPCVLCVDDEPRILIALKALLRAQYEVLTVDNGAAALDILRSRRVDVLISDQRMPTMTGVEVLRGARELQPRTIRLLLTGYSDLNAIIGSINEGEIFRFVSKPWANESLRETVAAAIDAARIEHLPEAEAPQSAASQLAASGPGVLILDHDPGEREQIAAALGNDWPIYTAASLEECIAVLERHHVGVLMTEIVIGTSTVTALLAALRQQQPSLVTIIVTGQAGATHAMDLINYGQIYRLLLKPVKPSLVRGTVAVAMRRFEMLSSRPEQVRRVAPAAAPVSITATLEKTGLLARIRRLWRRDDTAAAS
jgi:DNA-binding NtrC family response regulator